MFWFFKKRRVNLESKIFPVGFVLRKNKIIVFSKDIANDNSGNIDVYLGSPGSSDFKKSTKKINLFDGDKKKDSSNLCEVFFFSTKDLIYLIFTEKRSNQDVCSLKMVRKTAVSNNGFDFKIIGSASGLNLKNPNLFLNKKDGEGWMIGGNQNQIEISGFKFPNIWRDNLLVLKNRADFFDKNDLMPISFTILNDLMLLIYLNVFEDKVKIGGTFLSAYNPAFSYWRTSIPICSFTFEQVNSPLTFSRAILVKEKIFFYFFFANGRIVIKSITNPFSVPKKIEYQSSLLERSDKNPIIHPDHFLSSDFSFVFNPAAIKIENYIHLIFRAIGADGVSRLGYAKTFDGHQILDKVPYPVFTMKNPRRSDAVRRYDPVVYSSGGSFGGVEDPRIVKIDDKIYVTFNAFDGWDFIRIAVISITEKDFLAKRWNWSKPMLISPPGEINKNWVLFPEKINGKFAIVHSISPELQIDYVDSLEGLAFGERKIKSSFFHKEPRDRWDTWLRGVGPPPLRTDYGWILFYHTTTKDEPHKYKIGVLLLDIKDPTKILGRSKGPVFSPEKWYENESKPGVVYACGAVVDGDLVRVYYGGGDKHVCTASISLEKLIKYLEIEKC